MPTIVLSKAEICYEEQGEGDLLVLIPGFASGAWSWSWQADELAEMFRVITFDPRGVAKSKIIDGGAVSIEGITSDIAAMLNALSLEKAHILGISFGGFVAQEFAIRHPQRLKKLVLACTSFGGAGHVPPSPEILAAFASTRGLNTRERIRQYLTMAFLPEFVESNAEAVESFCDLREQNAVPQEVYEAQLFSATTFDAGGRVAAIAAETLVISGDRDRVVPVQNSINLAGKIPGAELKIVKNAGHMLFVERSTEFNGIVKDFLAA